MEAQGVVGDMRRSETGVKKGDKIDRVERVAKRMEPELSSPELGESTERARGIEGIVWAVQQGGE